MAPRAAAGFWLPGHFSSLFSCGLLLPEAPLRFLFPPALLPLTRIRYRTPVPPLPSRAFLSRLLRSFMRGLHRGPVGRLGLTHRAERSAAPFLRVPIDDGTALTSSGSGYFLVLSRTHSRATACQPLSSWRRGRFAFVGSPSRSAFFPRLGNACPGTPGLPCVPSMTTLAVPASLHRRQSTPHSITPAFGAWDVAGVFSLLRLRLPAHLSPSYISARAGLCLTMLGLAAEPPT